ncbi:MAG: LysM peptidoglycan-binding domain-containing protein [Chloroflexota bacterium]
MQRLLAFVIAFLLVFGIVVPAMAQGSTVHVVQRGENLYRIALRYGVTVDALAATNGLSNPRLIFVGQRLVIPAAGSAPAPQPPAAGGVHIVQPGENLYRIALRYGATVQALASVNNILNPGRIYVGQRLVIPGGAAPPSPGPTPPSGQSYVVRPGDTLSAIALRFGVSLWALVQANGIRNPSLIFVGQVLHIPAGQGAPPSSGVRWIDVDLGAQRLTAYQGNIPVRSTLVSTGLSGTPTLVGQFRIYVKYASAPMSGPGYYLPNVPHVMYYDRSYALHGTYWHDNFGAPMSHGCINLPTAEAKWLYGWAAVGTLVKIHY